MAIGHDEAVIPDLSNLAIRGAAVNSDILAQHRAFADPNIGRSAVKLQILRLATDVRKGMNLTTGTKRRDR